MPFCIACACLAPIAIGQQDRCIPLNAHIKGRHDIGAVGVIGYFAKPFRLALGAIHAFGHIKPLKGCVILRCDFDFGLPNKATLWQACGRHRQGCFVEAIIGLT